MAEASAEPRLDISRVPGTEPPPRKFIPQPLGEREPTPPPGPVQPRSGPATLPPQPRTLDISALPEMQDRQPPKFINPARPTVETQTQTPSLLGRLISRLGF